MDVSSFSQDRLFKQIPCRQQISCGCGVTMAAASSTDVPHDVSGRMDASDNLAAFQLIEAA